MPYANLPGRTVLLVSGEEAESFLQNLVTNDMASLGPEEARPGALLNPQGKILFDFLSSRADAGLRLDVAAAAAEAFAKRLTLYKLRARVTIAREDVAVFALWDETVPGALADTRFPDSPVARLYGEAPSGLEERTEADFEALRIASGVSESGTDFPAAEYFPHDLLLDQNAGVSFRKGCYVGQEVVSRMQHRGTARRRLVLVEAENHLTPGAELLAGSRPIGTVLAAAGPRGLAVLRIDKLADALDAGDVLSADGVPLEATIPSWAGYALPASVPAAAGEEP